MKSVKVLTRFGNELARQSLIALEDVAAVIVSSCARLVVNPEHTRDQTTGPFSIRQGIFNGWTLPELAILHRHRKRAL